MVWSLPELPMRWEALPCPLEAGWALIRLWELPKRADNGAVPWRVFSSCLPGFG